MSPLEPRSEFLHSGKNGIETSVAIHEVLAGFSSAKGKQVMEREKVKEIFRRLNAAGIRYALIGGLAYSEYAPPRATQDVDLLLLVEDVSKVRDLFPGCYRRGTAIAGIYEFEGTRFDVQPANRRLQIQVILDSVDASFEGEPVKVASLQQLLFLKLWASVERTEVAKRLRDQADIASLLEHNQTRITPQDIAGIAGNLLSLAYTPEESEKFREAVRWLNQVLDALKMHAHKFSD